MPRSGQAGRERSAVHGEGWDRSRIKSAKIRKALDTVVSPKTKLTKPVKKPKAIWVEPKSYAEVEYRDITSEGLLRASSFKGLTRKQEHDRRTTLSRHIYIYIGSTIEDSFNIAWDFLEKSGEVGEV
ncbi:MULTISPECIES: ATP dependent DNA ligase [Bradyrhizobium]|nr:hypothetical protein [Bradyrhizobium japonicum]MCD9112209.1 hypothetical protein [Bradyrhizobium japonicum]MCD9824449.1 hypothetical protein [Bradyrhizobium japonicum]WLB33477.1 hypothetical protein QIH85_12420 [Bradyrhizobium japonicum]WRJ88288.1 hypothetical protein R3F78_17435 [Bradyrhizobium japonicum]